MQRYMQTHVQLVHQDSSDLILKRCCVSCWLLASSMGFLLRTCNALHLLLVKFCMRFFIRSLLWPIELPLNSHLIVLPQLHHTPQFGTIHRRAEGAPHSVAQPVDEGFEQYCSQYWSLGSITSIWLPVGCRTAHLNKYKKDVVEKEGLTESQNYRITEW